MKHECSIIKDLLPLYVEGMVSEETAADIKEHLENCPACAAEYEQLVKSVAVEKEKPAWDNGDISALKQIKKDIRRKRIYTVLLAIAVTLATVLTCIRLWPVSVDYGSSQLYTREDMKIATGLIKDKVASWAGCKLYSIRYRGDELSQKELDYCNQIADENVTYRACMVFKASFRSPILGGGSWNANFVYDWSFHLAQRENGDWELVAWGAP